MPDTHTASSPEAPVDDGFEARERAYIAQRISYLPWEAPRFNADRAGAQTSPTMRRLLEKWAGCRALGANSYVSDDAIVHTTSLGLGRNSTVAAGAILRGAVAIGDNCTVNTGAQLAGKVTLGNGVRVAGGAAIHGFNHGHDRTDTPIWRQPLTSKGVVVGDGSWIGANSVIVDGVTIGAHCIVAAGAVVTRSFPDYQIIGGNPARSLGDRRTRALRKELRAFGEKVRAQLPGILARHIVRDAAGNTRVIDAPGQPERVRPWCDMVELASLAGCLPAGMSREMLIEKLGSFQDPATGLVPEYPPGSPQFVPVSGTVNRYNTMVTNYALELLGAHLPRPVTEVAAFSPDRLQKTLRTLSWRSHAWSAGDWVDCFASCLMINERHFGDRRLVDTLFAWLDAACSAETGLWGETTEKERLLLPVNCFYRLTRGTYAQFGRGVPHPERAIDTILTHAADPAFFDNQADTACNVLDVVHPLWLCLRQTDHRRAEILGWVERKLPVVLGRWIDDRGFDFKLFGNAPGLKGTEMWLAIVYYMADLLGVADALGYAPKGVHRPEGVAPGAAAPRTVAPLAPATPVAAPVRAGTAPAAGQAGAARVAAGHLKVRRALYAEDPYADLPHRYPTDLQGWGSTAPVFRRVIADLKPRLIVEVGTWKGGSAVHMAKICRGLNLAAEIVCVDTWLGNWQHWSRAEGVGSRADLRIHNGMPRLYWQFMSNVVEAGMQDIITPLPLTGVAGAKLFANMKLRPDIVYIDGDHEYESVRFDLALWLDVLAPGGVLIGDDYSWPGVRRAVTELLAQQSLDFETQGTKFTLRRKQPA